ncbi:MAG: nucleotide-binding domain containing protein [Pseudolabrys sp.]|nr:nucleotide-binding domain containing protein [Pseudolabrys sp.]
MVGPDLVSDFARFGIDLKLGLSNAPQSGSPRIFLADAETDDDLKTIVDAGMLCGRVLWCGCAGLADILAGGGERASAPIAPRMLVICGTRHSVASLQTKPLETNENATCVRLRPNGDLASVAQTVNERLRAGHWAALVADLPQLSADAARGMLGKMMDDLFPQLDRPDALFVMGGDTLAICCGALGAKSLAVRGLLTRGIPVSEFADGVWAGMTVISKSGAFGAEDTLIRIMEMTGAIDSGNATAAHGELRQKAFRH